MKLVSWNVAGFRACLKKGFADFFEAVDADVVCLQEVKALADQIEFHPEGYELILNPAERKGYSGTLVYTRVKPLRIRFGMGIEHHDHEGRMITLEFEEFFLVNTYVPNVKRDLSRMEDRMCWEEDYRAYLKELEKQKPVVSCGDYNVAHTEIDIKNAKANIGNAGFTYEERAKFTELLASGFVDSYRHFHPGEIDHYTWWSYMPGVRDRNIGWRIDYFLVSESFLPHVEETVIYDQVYGSDHCPIGITLNIPPNL